jgi:hypothetical protein
MFVPKRPLKIGFPEKLEITLGCHVPFSFAATPIYFFLRHSPFENERADVRVAFIRPSTGPQGSVREGYDALACEIAHDKSEGRVRPNMLVPLGINISLEKARGELHARNMKWIKLRATGKNLRNPPVLVRDPIAVTRPYTALYDPHYNEPIRMADAYLKMMAEGAEIVAPPRAP